MSKEIYNWRKSGSVADWRAEGFGEVLRDDDGSFHFRVFNHGPWKNKANAWLKTVELPDNFEVLWGYKNGSDTGSVVNVEGVMILFNAAPVILDSIWDDPRPYGLYDDIHSHSKMFCYSCGFYRSPYPKGTVDSNLRKLGGRVQPGEMGNTIVSTGREPIAEEDAGTEISYRLVRTADSIRMWCNDELIHDYAETHDDYEPYPEGATGGYLAFRNFSGYVDGVFPNIIINQI